MDEAGPENVQTPVSPAPVVNTRPVKSFAVFGILAGFGLFGLGGFMIGRLTADQSQPVAIEIPEPSPAVELTVTKIPEIPVNNVSVPESWKKYTGDDKEFGVKTSMAMPPGFSFRFTGSEFTIQKDADASELWDYAPSVYAKTGEEAKNQYDGGSRRAWHASWLAERSFTDKVTGVEEKPLNGSTYLDISVQIPVYDDHGVESEKRTVHHFVWVQNGILHILRPGSESAYQADAVIAANIEPILASLTSEITR